MRVVGQVRILIGLALLGGAGIVLADVPEQHAASATETVLIFSEPKCDDATPERARTLADQAWRDAAYKRAGECYLIAGQHGLADEAFVKAAAATTPETSRRLAANLDEVKAQARQVKAAFHRR
jgi:hypothetical protein